jgi:gamma-glutamyltranspeptidase/glutathione hydrolase
MERTDVSRALAWAALASALLASCTRSEREQTHPRAAQGAAPPVALRAAGSAAPPPAPVPATPPTPDADIVIRGGGAHAVRGEHGVVTSVEEQATRAGVAMLEQGGNAVDAAIAVAYALAVTHPSAGNIGGGGFMLIRMAGGPTHAIDFREKAPSGLTRKRFGDMIAAKARGPAAVGVPGTVAGLELARKLAVLPRRTLLEPAIRLARDGFVLGARQGSTIAWSWPELREDPAARALFGNPAGSPRTGGKLKNPDLARVLERIADLGAPGFYEGPTAQAIVRALAPAQMMTLADLSTYSAVEREPLRFPYRGLEVEAMPPSSAGGVALAQTLLMLERLAAHRAPPGSAEELHLFIEASRRAHAERRFAVSDPDGLAAERQAELRHRWTDPFALLGPEPIARDHATPSAKVHPLFARAIAELEHTTHFSVADAAGNVVSCTTTLSNGFGARMVAPGTGIVLNNSVAAFGTAGENLPNAGRRTTSSMAPTLVLSRGKPILVLGTPGGDTIPSTIVQVLRNVVDHGMTIDAAVDAPRIHHGFAPDEVRYEAQRSPPAAVLQGLRRLGHRVVPRHAIGDANDILIDGDGVAWAYADPREGGLALGARAPAK